MDSEVSSKKSKKLKTNKKVKNLAEVAKKEDIVRKQQELMRVLHVKNYQLQNGNLTYLDYVELKEELFRLNALKDVFNSISSGKE